MAFTTKRQLSIQQARKEWNDDNDDDEIDWDDEIEKDLFYDKTLSESESEKEINKKVIVYQKKKISNIVNTINNVDTSFNTRNELDDFTNKHANDVFLKNLSHALSKKHLKGSIDDIPIQIENSNEKKKSLVINLKEIITRLEVREKDKSDMEA